MKTNTLFLALMLTFTIVSGQKFELKKANILTETFTGDTFDYAFYFAGAPYSRKVIETFPKVDTVNLRMNSGCRMHFDTNKLNGYLKDKGGIYDSIEVEILLRHRFQNPYKVGFMTRVGQRDFEFMDIDTHTVKTVFHGWDSENDFVFKNYEVSSSLYITHAKLNGYRFDTIPTDTNPTTGINENLSDFVRVYASGNKIILDNPQNYPLSMTVFGLSGNVVTSQKTVDTSGNIAIPIPGIYIILIIDNKGNTIIKKLVLD